MRVPKLTYSNLTATLALFLALGGGAYALTLGRGDVKRKHIARNAVTSKKIAPNAVRGVDALESSFGTVPNAGKLGGLPPTAFVTGNNAQQRVVVEAVPEGSDGVVHSLTGFGTIQFRDCASVASGVGDVAYDNTSGGTQDVIDTTLAGNFTPQMGHFAVEEDALLNPLYQLPANENPARIEIQAYSRGAPGEVLYASLAAVKDDGADVCRYSLWSNRIDEEQG